MRGAALTAGRKLTMRVVARSADDDLGHFGGLVGSLRAGGGRILTTAFALDTSGGDMYMIDRNARPRPRTTRREIS